MKTRLLFTCLLVVATAGLSFSTTQKKPQKMTNQHTKTVLFITGAFVSNTCWDEWKAYFESKGYHCIAPAWPYKDAPAAVLRSRQPNPDIASLRLRQLVDYYADIAGKLPEKPIIIGHSLGGLITQLLVQRGLASYAVAIHSVPTRGVSTFNFTALKAGAPVLGFFTSTKKAYLMSFKTWQYAFTNGMPLDEQKKAYNTYLVPESKLTNRDWMTNAAKVDYKKPHVPLLFTSGGTDHIIPASFNYNNYLKYSDSHSVTDYKEFEGRNHFVLGQPTWKEDADYILNWLNVQQGTHVQVGNN